MVNRLLHNICKSYIRVEEVLSELNSHDEESLTKIKEHYNRWRKMLIQDLYHESKRLGGDEPREQSNIWDNEPARVLVHRILVKARELDFADVSYEDYVDKDSLKEVLDQLDNCCKHKEMLKK